MSEKQFITHYERGDETMSTTIYEDLDLCRDYDAIDSILNAHGHSTDKEKYDYLVDQMGVTNALYTNVLEDDFKTKYSFAKDAYLLGHWRMVR